MSQSLDKKFGRREFLKYSGMLGVGAAAFTALPVSESLAFDSKLHKVTRTRQTMGTLAAITVMHSSPAQADDAIAKAFDEMDRVARLLDRFDSASPVSVLNRDGAIDGMPAEMAEVLGMAAHYHQASQGRFDVTVKPVVDLYQASFKGTGKAPEDKAIQQAASLVDGSKVQVQGGKARLLAHGMGVTLDGIAKGYVIDAGARMLKSQNVAHALINAGGDIRAIGGKGQSKAWTVAVRHPRSESEYADKIRMTNGAVATSGNYEIYFDREKMFHHIVQPATGRSPYELASATVWAPTVASADALSTAVFVMGSDKGVRFIETQPQSECMVIARTNKKTSSSGWVSA